ncbi:MAG: hypothetical protein CMO80_07840 [Verrucomicrobiales bacterium]|nr:hypothetical protein [Verrucomicrobiales bacterium]
MVPAAFMVTIKKWGHLLVLLILAGSWQACTPPGPSALLRGESQIKEGDYAGAVASLTEAVKLLPNLPQAWNHLGLAYHYQQKYAEASSAYRKAIELDYSLAPARSNYGSLLLQFQQSRDAANEFATYTELRPEDAGGWMRRGMAEWRANQWEAACASLKNALRIDQAQVDVWNALGMIEHYRKNPSEAQQAFHRGLSHKSDHAPSMYNLALVSHFYMPRRPVDHREFALQTYRNYLALPDRPLFTDSIRVIADQLNRELHPPPPAPAPPTPPVQTAALTSQKPEPEPEPEPEPSPAPSPQPDPDPKPKPEPEPKPEATQPTEVEKPGTEVVQRTETKPAAPLETVNPAPQKPEPPPPAPAAPVVAKVDPTPKPEFVEPKPVVFVPDLNKLETKTEAPMAPVSPAPAPAPATQFQSPSPAPVTPTRSRSAYRGLRYSYLSPKAPSAGFRNKAITHFDAGRRWQRIGRHDDAITAYRQAIKWDSAFFEAYHNLGLAAAGANDFLLAAVAFETALSLKPESSKTRYHFANLLIDRSYHLDGVNELKKVVVESPDDASAHLLLANTLDQKLHDPAGARSHYQEVLRISPSHSQGTKIRYWLRSH